MKQTKNSRKGPLSDEEIVALYWERNENAINATDDKYGKYLFSVAYNILRNDPDCDECVNDTYLNTWNRIPPTRPNIFQVFLSKITRDVAVDKYRRSRAEKRVPSELTISLEELNECIPACQTPEEELLAREIVRVLNDWLRELDANDRFMFVCRYYYADTVSYISDLLDVSNKTVYRRLSELRSQLRQRFEKEGIAL